MGERNIIREKTDNDVLPVKRNVVYAANSPFSPSPVVFGCKTRPR